MKKLLLCVSLYALLLLPAQAQQAAKKENKVFRVMLDPGHGGKDPGTETSDPKKYKNEKDIVLNIAKLAGGYLGERVKGVEVRYTRTTDKYLTLDERVLMAHDWEADLFVSVHCNSNPDSLIAGTQVHIHSRDFKNSLRMARLLEHEFTQRARRDEKALQTLEDRGYNLFVLQFTKMPSVLVEVGFLSNPKEERYLNTAHGQDIMASAIFRAVRAYKKKYFDKGLN